MLTIKMMMTMMMKRKVKSLGRKLENLKKRRGKLLQNKLSNKALYE